MCFFFCVQMKGFQNFTKIQEPINCFLNLENEIFKNKNKNNERIKIMKTAAHYNGVSMTFANCQKK